MSASRLLVGPVRHALELVADGSVDLVMTSPPFLALRSYLPDDHPDKPLELGNEPDPGAFLDALLDVVEAVAPKLAPHGSLVVELGDTYAGSGGHGGDYEDGGMREGQPKFAGSGRQAREAPRPARNGRKAKVPLATSAKYRGAKGPEGESFRDRAADVASGFVPDRMRTRRQLPGWPRDKSKLLVPQLFAVALAYGFNPLTGRETPDWIVRNVVAWCRPNPPVGRDGDKFRPATTYLTVATQNPRRWWDGDAVRTAPKEPDRTFAEKSDDPNPRHGPPSRGEFRQNPGGAPLLDWWEIPTSPYPGAHYATYPRALVEPVVKSMCPRQVCRTCGEPRSRIVEAVEQEGRPVANGRGGTREQKMGRITTEQATGMHYDHASRVTVGWSDCGHGDWRNGLVLDPFAGSGTTLEVASGLGRDSVGVDIDERNVDLARERVGMFLTVEEVPRADRPGVAQQQGS